MKMVKNKTGYVLSRAHTAQLAHFMDKAFFPKVSWKALRDPRAFNWGEGYFRYKHVAGNRYKGRNR